MNISEYIRTGIIESYVLGLATDEDASQYERLRQVFPELTIAQSEFECRLESHFMANQVPPPIGVRERVEDRIRELPAIRPISRGTWTSKENSRDNYLTIDGSSTHIRVHKYWRPTFIIIFILSKLLLAAAIYYFVQYQAASREINKLQQDAKVQRAAVGQ